MQKQEKLKAGRPRGSTSFDPKPARAFGSAVRSIRLNLKISQEELSNISEIERSHMGKIERGEHMPNFVLILRLAKALNVRPGELVDKAVDLL
jgi:XRE family transcriptional regulator, regulator of sulfur utilization